jgi:hypothetical protein
VSLETRPPGLAAQDRQLMAQHQNLELLGSILAPEEHEQFEQAADDDVQA